MMEQEITEDFALLAKAYLSMGVEVFSCSPWNTPFRKRLGYRDLESFA
jgi:hypothetical protein